MRTFYEECPYLDKSEPELLDTDDSDLAPAGAKSGSLLRPMAARSICRTLVTTRRRKNSRFHGPIVFRKLFTPMACAIPPACGTCAPDFLYIK